MTNIERIDYSKTFVKNLKKSPNSVRLAFRSRLENFLKDKFHPLLNNHSLTGKYRGHRSINVTGDWRVIFRELQDGKIIYFDTIGTHSQLYRK